MSASNQRRAPSKISSACSACKGRKTKCSGGIPCEACAARGSDCSYDATTDQRRKIANQRNIQDLNTARVTLNRYKQMVGGIIATCRGGSFENTQDLLYTIRSDTDLLQLEAYLWNVRQYNPDIESAFAAINLVIDGSIASGSQNSNSDGVQSPPMDRIRKKRHRSGKIDDFIYPPISVKAAPWTSVTEDDEFVSHLLSLWFAWAHPWWHWIDKETFLNAMRNGDLESPHCTPYLVNMILADSCLLDTYDDEDQEPNMELRDQFYAEAVRGIDAENGAASLTTVQAMGVQWTYLITNGEDQAGQGLIHRQNADSLELEQWQAQLIRQNRHSSQVMKEVDKCLDRITWSLYALNAISAMSSSQIDPPAAPMRSRPVHDHRIDASHVNNTQDHWTPYPEPKTAKSEFHHDCHYSSLLSLAEITAKSEALLPQARQAQRDGQVEGHNISAGFYDRYRELRDWAQRLPDCMHLENESTPHVLILHALHHWAILNIAKEAASAEAGHPERSVIMQDAGQWQATAMNSSLAITNLMRAHCHVWGADHFPVIVTQPMSLALITLLDNLTDSEKISAFTDLCFCMYEAAKRFRICKGILRLVQTTAKQRKILLPDEVEQLFTSGSAQQARAMRAAGEISVAYLLGKWDDFKIN